MNQQAFRISLVLFAIIGAFVGVRAVTVPKTYGLKGSYDSVAPTKLASHEAKYAGRAACTECHDDQATLSPHVKAGVGCETCHGPSAKHADDHDVNKLTSPVGRAFCLTCHATNLARRATFPQVSPDEHNPDDVCTKCHTVHPKEAPKPEAPARKPEPGKAGEKK